MRTEEGRQKMIMPELIKYLGKKIRAYFYDGRVIEGKLFYYPPRSTKDKREASYFKIGSSTFGPLEVQRVEEVKI